MSSWILGVPRAPPSPTIARTETLTFLATDIEGSTQLSQRVGHDSCTTILANHLRIIRRHLGEHDWPADEHLRVRTGIHSGEAAQTTTGLVGFEFHRAARP